MNSDGNAFRLRCSSGRRGWRFEPLGKRVERNGVFEHGIPSMAAANALVDPQKATRARVFSNPATSCGKSFGSLRAIPLHSKEDPAARFSNHFAYLASMLRSPWV